MIGTKTNILKDLDLERAISLADEIIHEHGGEEAATLIIGLAHAFFSSLQTTLIYEGTMSQDTFLEFVSTTQELYLDSNPFPTN